MKANTILLGGLLALPGQTPAQSVEPAHEPAETRSAQVQAALQAVKARVPRPRWDAIRETRVAIGGKSARAGRLVELDEVLNLAVVVVLDEHGTPHSECVESAPPQERDR